MRLSREDLLKTFAYIFKAYCSYFFSKKRSRQATNIQLKIIYTQFFWCV